MEEKKKFQIIKTLEDWRWTQDKEEYFFETSTYCFKNNINNCFDKNNNNQLTEELAEKILLTHYLLYICDRQMDYRYIFKAGGYVISHMVEKYIKECSELEINWNNIFKICKKEKSYFLCAPITDDNENEIYKYFKNKARIIDNNGESTTSKDKYELLFKTKKDNQQYAIFSSRYMLQDIACMYKTLLYLKENCDGSFKKLLKNNSNVICTYDENKKINSEKSLANALFELTYQGISKILAKDFEKCNSIEEILDAINKKIENHKKDSLEKSRYSLKRMWCIIRDFLRHPIFSKCFQLTINKTDKEFEEYIKNNYHCIELPGDVWNNNSKFAECFWGKSDKNFKSSKFAREKYKKNGENWKGCKPIDFDITFNFVPKMCEVDMCDICPLKENAKKDEWKNKLCHEQEGKLCPLALYSCGIKHKCKGDNCILTEGLQ